MSTATEELVQESLADIGDDKKLLYFRSWIKDFTKDASTKDEMIGQYGEWLDGLSADEITRSYQRPFNPIYLNMLSVFGERLPAEDVHSLAVRCMKSKFWSESEFHYHLSKLLEAVKSARAGREPGDARSLIRLKGWDAGLIRTLLERGRGLIVCTFRFGLVRFIPTEMALLGFRALEAVNKPTFEVMGEAFDSLGPGGVADEIFDSGGRAGEVAAENICLLKTINAEEDACTVQLVDTLKAGGIVGLCVEGNTGSDGPWGDTSKSVVKFFDYDIAVKNGAARLASALGTPILPVVAVREDEGFGRLVFSDPIVPPRGLKRSEGERFVQDTMQTLYGLLESYAARQPEQWEGWSALHRWRVRGPEEAASDNTSRAWDAAEVAGLLGGGRSFRINRARVAPLPTRHGLTWVDLKTLRGYQNPQWAGGENILQALTEEQGLGLPWVELRGGGDPGWRQRVFELLAYLGKSHLVVAS